LFLLVLAAGFALGWSFGRSALIMKQIKDRKAGREIAPDGSVVNTRQEFTRVHYD
jgi:hypothetical protein